MNPKILKLSYNQIDEIKSGKIINISDCNISIVLDKLKHNNKSIREFIENEDIEDVNIIYLYMKEIMDQNIQNKYLSFKRKIK